jgi:hypothetical protein
MRAAAALLLALAAGAATAAPVPPPAPRIVEPATVTVETAEASDAAAPAPPGARSAAAIAAAPRLAPPPRRPSTLCVVRAASAPAPTRQALSGDGGLCGDPRLSCARVAAMTGPGACGIAQPVRLAGAAGVRLEPPVTIGCDAARAVADWIEASVRPAARQTLGADAAALRTFAGYACRTRNNRPGGKLSEHAKGRAIDIGGVRLSDGREILLKGNWRSDAGAFFRQVWRGACGPFGTVLGPDADRWHQDHFHLDVARYRSGPYCK